MRIQYFARWIWDERRGVDPLSEKKAAGIHEKGRTYVAVLIDEHLALTLRKETRFVDLGFLAPSMDRRGGVALVLNGHPTIDSIDVWRDSEEVVRLQGGHGDTLTVTFAPFEEPTEFEPKPLPSMGFPAFGEYGSLTKLPRDPWAYVELPPGFRPPRPSP